MPIAKKEKEKNAEMALVVRTGMGSWGSGLGPSWTEEDLVGEEET